jgi:calcium-dependent protein kinase
LTKAEIQGLKELFESMDTDHSGTITYAELKRGLAMQGADLAESEVQQLMESVHNRIQSIARFFRYYCRALEERSFLPSFLPSVLPSFWGSFLSFTMPAINKSMLCSTDSMISSCAQADADGNGLIDYMEFITATMNMTKMEQEDRLQMAFRHFDRDHSG